MDEAREGPGDGRVAGRRRAEARGDADPYMCASLVFHDRKTGLVYDCSPSWQPDFDEAGNLAGTAEDWVVPIHCDPYPFEVSAGVRSVEAVSTQRRRGGTAILSE